MNYKLRFYNKSKQKLQLVKIKLNYNNCLKYVVNSLNLLSQNEIFE